MEPHHDHGTHKHHVESKNLVYSILLNIVIVIAQLIGGILSGSLALLSDALHNFSDVLSLLFSYVAHKLSYQKTSDAKSFGLKRAELIAAFVNSSTLVLVAGYLIYEAIIRFFNTQEIASGMVIWLALLGIVANGASVLLLKKDAGHNLNMKSAYLHLLTDMLASVAVLIGGLLMKFYQIYWIDSVLTLVIALYLIVEGVDLLKKSAKMLMLFTPENINIEAIVREVHKINGVKKLYDIHVWHLNEAEIHLEARLECSEDISISQFNTIAILIEKKLLEKFGITNVTLQPGIHEDGL